MNLKNALYFFFTLLFKSINLKKLFNFYSIKTKIIIVLSFIFFFIFFKILLISSPNNDIDFLYDEIKNINNFLLLKEKPLSINDSLINKEKLKIFQILSKENNKSISFVDTIIFYDECNFGNCIISLNKLFFFCEIISCKSILLDKDVYWFLKNKIQIDKFKFSIEVCNIKKYNNSGLLFFNSYTAFNSFFYIKPQIRIDIIRNEIINNLNKIIIDKEDLFIHIRSGDIFIYPHPSYSQPPLCFYRKILNNNKYKKVYLISQSDNNPIIEKLIKEYPSIIHFKNSIKKDISFLVNAYNLVASVSTFFISIIELNYNLRYVWDYNNYKISTKIISFHYDLYKFPNNFIIFRMEPSLIYQNIMYKWKNTKRQRKLMLKEKCFNNFRIIYK